MATQTKPVQAVNSILSDSSSRRALLRRTLAPAGAALAAILATGCVSAPRLEATLASYEGAPESAITLAFGEPRAVTVNEAGLRVLTYGKRGLFTKPDCIARFFVNGEGLVQRWQWSGRHCQAFTESSGFDTPRQ